MTSVATSPARSPFVTHIFVPLTTYSSPSRTARVRIACTSEPHSGSVIENAPRSSPVAIRGRQRSFCSSVPWRISMFATIKCVLMIPESVIQPRGQLARPRRIGEQIEPEAAVLLGDRDPEDAQLLQSLDDVVGEDVVVLQL